MKSITIKVEDKVLTDADAIIAHLNTSRQKYFSNAIQQYNSYVRRKLFKKQLTKESKLVSKDTLAILKEFEELNQLENLKNI